MKKKLFVNRGISYRYSLALPHSAQKSCRNNLCYLKLFIPYFNYQPLSISNFCCISDSFYMRATLSKSKRLNSFRPFGTFINEIFLIRQHVNYRLQNLTSTSVNLDAPLLVLRSVYLTPVCYLYLNPQTKT